MEFGLGKSYNYSAKVQSRIEIAIKWLENHSVQELLNEPIGNKEISEGVELRFQSYDTREYSDMKYETHRDHVDIHYMIQGSEWVRWADEGTAQPASEYDPDVEIQYFEHPSSHNKALLTDRHYAIFYPEDVHAAHGVVNNEVTHNRKLCVKIAIN